MMNKIKLEYNVLKYDWNTKDVVPVNILKYVDVDDLKKRIKKREIVTREDLSKYVDRELRYYCWGRAECEILITDLSGDINRAKKIDMYYQAKINFDLIIDYIIKKLGVNFE